MQCKAKSKRSGERCRRQAMIGKEVCAMHGGKTPSGLASPNFKHGRYSKYLPVAVSERYRQAITDPDLLNLADEIAVLDSRAMVLFSKIDESGGTAKIWDELRGAVGELETARQRGDAAGLAMALDEMVSLVKRGSAETARWREVYDLFERRRRLVESERKRREAMQNMVTSEQMMLLVTAIANLVKQYVSDREALTGISAGLADLLSSRTGSAS